MGVDVVGYQFLFGGRKGWRRQLDENLIEYEGLHFALRLLLFPEPVEFSQPDFDGREHVPARLLDAFAGCSFKSASIIVRLFFSSFLKKSPPMSWPRMEPFLSMKMKIGTWNCWFG